MGIGKGEPVRKIPWPAPGMKKTVTPSTRLPSCQDGNEARWFILLEWSSTIHQFAWSRFPPAVEQPGVFRHS